MSPASDSFRQALSPEVFRIAQALAAAGGRPVLVGGWVRDVLLGERHGQTNTPTDSPIAGDSGKDSGQDSGQDSGHGPPPQGADFDLEVYGLPLAQLRTVLRTFGPVHMVGRHFGVLKLATAQAGYDVSVPRRESNVGKGHKGFLVEPDPHMTFDEAAARRDFTINAMGYDLTTATLLDPHGGRRDLQAGLLRHVSDAFGEDPLRVLRAMQFAGRFGFAIAPETLAVCRSLDLNELPRERIWEEFRKLLLLAPRPSQGLAYVEALGVLPYFPELQRLHAAAGDPPPWQHLLRLLDEGAASRARVGGRASPGSGTEARANAGANAGASVGGDARILMLALLCAPLQHSAGAALQTAAVETTELQTTGSPVTEAESLLARLTHEGALIEGVHNLLRHLAAPEALYARRAEVQPGEIRRLALAIALPFLVTAAAALQRAQAPVGAASADAAEFPAGQWLERAARRLGVWDAPPQPLLMGRHLLERGFTPGPHLGVLLGAAFEAQLDGRLATLEEALAWLDGQEHPPSTPPQAGAGKRKRSRP